MLILSFTNQKSFEFNTRAIAKQTAVFGGSWNHHTRIDSLAKLFFRNRIRVSQLKLFSLTMAERGPSIDSTVTAFPSCQWLRSIMPIATFVWKSGDQADDVT